MNTFTITLSIILKNFLIILSLTATFSCVPIQQQIIDSQNQRLSYYEPLQISVSKDRFLETLNPQTTDFDLSFENGKMKIYPELMNENFQSRFSIPGYGSIYAGELTRKYDRQTNDCIEILLDNLLFTINYGGGKRSALVEYDLIWNGEYYMTGDIPTVDLVLSFKDLDPQRANIHRYIRFDLTPLRFGTSNQINISLLGYDRLIVYRY